MHGLVAIIYYIYTALFKIIKKYWGPPSSVQVGHTLSPENVKEIVNLTKIKAWHLTKCLQFVSLLLIALLFLLQSLYTDEQQPGCLVS